MNDRDDSLDQLMQRMAANDSAFLFAFIDEFGPKVAWVVRGILTEMGRGDLVRDRAEFEGLTIDACFVIFGRASGWRPGGAKPWTWAHKAIRAEIARSIGHRTVELGADRDFDGEADSHVSVVVDLAGDSLSVLIERHPRVRLLDQAIRAVGSQRDQKIYWAYRIQQGMGDPSPARTVADELGLRADNVRQISRRHGLKVKCLVAADPSFSGLRDHGWLAA